MLNDFCHSCDYAKLLHTIPMFHLILVFVIGSCSLSPLWFVQKWMLLILFCCYFSHYKIHAAFTRRLLPSNWAIVFSSGVAKLFRTKGYLPDNNKLAGDCSKTLFKILLMLSGQLENLGGCQHAHHPDNIHFLIQNFKIALLVIFRCYRSPVVAVLAIPALAELVGSLF